MFQKFESFRSNRSRRASDVLSCTHKHVDCGRYVGVRCVRDPSGTLATPPQNSSANGSWDTMEGGACGQWKRLMQLYPTSKAGLFVVSQSFIILLILYVTCFKITLGAFPFCCLIVILAIKKGSRKSYKHKNHYTF